MDQCPGSATVGSFDPIDFLETAVATPSCEDVATMRARVRTTLEDRGVDVRVDDAGNLLASRGADWRAATRDCSPNAAGERTRRHLVLNTHLDTVSPYVACEWGQDGDRLYGRGACDAKGPLAAMLAAFLGADPGAGTLTLALTPDEETYSTGAHALVTRPSSPVREADSVIVGEPTGLDVCTAAPGRFEGTIELAGEHAHAADPEAGRNAVDALTDVLAAVRTFDDRADATPTHPQLGDPTLTPTVVAGGDATNQVPATARLTVDRRPVPPETPDSFRTAFLDHLRDHVPAAVDVSVSLTDRPTPPFGAWATDQSASIVRTLAAESAGAIRPFGAAAEASYFASHAPTVVYGPGELTDTDGPIAHADGEYVRVDAVRTAASVLTSVVETHLATTVSAE